MPIQKDRSKDIPGKEGYSVRDIEKLIDVIDHPEKYDVDINDTGEEKDSCFKDLFQFCLLVLFVVSYIHAI